MSIQKVVDIEEIRNAGILQEANRLFFHPRGLALCINTDQDKKWLSILDWRDDLEGGLFGDTTSESFKNKAEQVENLYLSKLDVRMDRYGFVIEPLDNKIDEVANG